MGECMSIFILEDDVIQAESLKQVVKEICEKQQIPFDFIEATSRCAQIIEKIPLTTYLPIYFLDIEIKNERQKGLEVAQEIRKYDPDGIIVFVSTHEEFAPISYQYMVSALTFIDKSLPFNERYQMIEKCLQHYQQRNTISVPTDDFIVENGHTTVRVPFATVQYIKTDEPHRLLLVTEDRSIRFYGKLKDIEKLDERLVRCHQSYLVNTMHVSSFNARAGRITLNNNHHIPVSRRLSRKVRDIVKG